MSKRTSAAFRDIRIKESKASQSPPPQARRGYLGMELDDLSAELAQREGLAGDKGIYTSGVFPESPAVRAGVQPGDIILRTNARQVPTPGEFLDLVVETPIGQSVELELRRYGQTRTVSIVVAPLPEDPPWLGSAPTVAPPAVRPDPKPEADGPTPSIPPGWISLFDGKLLAGWERHGVRNRTERLNVRWRNIRIREMK